MGIGRTNAGGGTSLNFTVKTYHSKTDLKADNPKENTIGVITTTTMRNWLFSSTEPTDPEFGMVWILVGTSSTVSFNALKKNQLQVYPLSAKQYISGSWADVTAMSYQGGEWVEWVEPATYLYNAGDQCADITGGWTSEEMMYRSSNENGPYAPVITAGSTQLAAEITEYSWHTGVVWTEEDIDVTEYNTIEFTGYTDGTYDDEHICLIVIPSDSSYWYSNAICKTPIGNNAGSMVSLDISSVNGSYRVGFGMLSDDSGVKVWMDKLELK